MDKGAIGVFDSGLGGLTVLNKLVEKYPNQEYIYIADTKRNPYGDKTRDQIIKYAIEISEYLVSRGVKMIIIACNTVSAYAYEILKDRLDIPIYSILNSGVNSINRKTDKVALLATQATVDSNTYQKSIKEMGVGQVKSVACPEIVLSIESGENDTDVKKSIIKKYMNGLESYNQVLLGCTHYPIWINEFKELYPYKKIIDPSDKIIEEVSKVLDNNIVEEKLNYKIYKKEILITGNVKRFASNLSNLSSINKRLKDFTFKKLELKKM